MGKTKEELIAIGKKTQFSSTNQPKRKNGRKPSIYTQAQKDGMALSREDFIVTLLYIMQMTKDEIKKEIIDNPETPIWVMNYARALFNDTGHYKTNTIKEITEVIFGSPKQTINSNQNVVVRSAFSGKSKEEVDDYIAKAMKSLKDK